MNKNEVIKALQEGREAFLETLEGLDDDTLLRSGVVGEWSVKDLLFHLTMWEAELVKLLWQASQGQTPTTIHFTDATDDETNLAWSRLGESRPLEQVWQDFHAVRRQTIQRVRALADKDFGDPARFPWLDGRPLEDWIAADTHGHEAEHTAQIRAWRKNLV